MFSTPGMSSAYATEKPLIEFSLAESLKAKIRLLIRKIVIKNKILIETQNPVSIDYLISEFKSSAN